MAPSLRIDLPLDPPNTPGPLDDSPSPPPFPRVQELMTRQMKARAEFTAYMGNCAHGIEEKFGDREFTKMRGNTGNHNEESLIALGRCVADALAEKGDSVIPITDLAALSKEAQDILRESGTFPQEPEMPVMMITSEQTVKGNQLRYDVERSLYEKDLTHFTKSHEAAMTALGAGEVEEEFTTGFRECEREIKEELASQVINAFLTKEIEKITSELSMAWEARKGNDVADIFHSSDK